MSDLIRHALVQQQVAAVFAVPGAPATSLAAAISVGQAGDGKPAFFEWSVNEKVAVETAFGIAQAGVRSAVIMKQCGLHTALDSLMNAAFHTVKSGLVIFVGDDQSASASTLLLDSRLLAKVMGVPCLELSVRANPSKVIAAGYRISTDCSIPVLIRFVDGIEPTADLVLGDAEKLWSHPEAANTTLSPAYSSPIEPQRVTKLGRRQAHRIITWPRVVGRIGESGLTSEHHGSSCEVGVIDFGSDGVRGSDSVCRFSSATAWPIPAAALRFVGRHRSTVVLETPLPFWEDELSGIAREKGTTLIGRRTGHLPPEGPILDEDTSAALRAARGALETGELDHGKRWEEVELKAPASGGHKFDKLFRALTSLSRDGVFVAVDVGSAVKLCYPPYDASVTSLCLGSPVAVAAGFTRVSGRPAISVIGDYGLLHSGLEAIAEMAARAVSGVIVVLANGIMEQTGGQPTLAGDKNLSPVDLQSTLRALGVREVFMGTTSQSEVDHLSRIKHALDQDSLIAFLIEEGQGVYPWFGASMHDRVHRSAGG